jgi:hypothetical protein
MRKMGDLMKDLGFREDASDDVKIAFIKNLAKAAYGVDLVGPGEAPKASTPLVPIAVQARREQRAEPPSWLAIGALEKPSERQADKQLSFDFGSNGEDPSPQDQGRSLETTRKSG